MTGGQEEAARRGLAFIRTIPVRKMTVIEKALLVGCLHSRRDCSDIVVRATGELRNIVTPGWFEGAPLAEVFLVLNVLHEVRPYVVDGAMLGRAVGRLVACEVAAGGPYISELGQPGYVANASVAVFMSWAAKPLPEVDMYVGNWCDTTLLTRAISPFRAALGVVLSQGDESGGPLNQKDLDLAVQRLVELQRPDGSWPELTGPGIVLSPLAVTLLMLDSMRLLSTRPARQRMQQAAKRVIQVSYPLLEDVPAEVAVRLRGLIDYVDKGDARLEVRLLPTFFAQSLVRPPRVATADFCRWLGVANVFAWIAYTIYDDFFDDEGDPVLLPGANVSVRLAQRLYWRALPDPGEYNRLIAYAFDRVDAANAWEINNLRQKVSDGCLRIDEIPDMTDLTYIADRAYFHALGPMVLMTQIDGDRDKAAEAQVSGAFCDYLIARQLDDDLRDWRKDLQRGHITPVTAAILRALGGKRGEFRFVELLPRAELAFWQEALPEICDLALMHIARSREAMAKTGLFKRSHKIGMLQSYIENSMHDAMAAREQGQEFLRTFK
ncbi:MAG TPA: hypothetical protein VF733_05450 [Candidatus Saccharimonadales bacterium]